MNDPGLDEPIGDAENATHPSQGEWAEEIEEEDLLLDPSRWWFASTACPLIAGTFGPMGSAFNLCALLEKWREVIPAGKTEDTGTAIEDPTWLLAVNGISLGCALIGNASLLLNMVGRLSFKYAQPITIVGFSLAALLLIALVAVASTSIFQLQPRSDHALTQAFYYACYAAGLYTIIGILMTITVYGALAGKYPKRFEISNSQRTLMLQTISFMAYLLVGAAIYSSLEGWYYLDAVFWADFTLLTIGLGVPLVPITHAGRSLIIPFTFGGILAVGLVIGSIRSMLLEKGAQKMHARATEKKRQEIIRLGDTDVGRSRFHWPWQKDESRKRLDTKYMPERKRREEEFHAMRRIQEHAAKKQKWTALAMSTSNAALLWFVGAVVFWYTEYKQSWTYFESMYFSYTSLITLGYGDLQPLSNSGKSFFVFWSLLAIPTLTVLISDMGDTVVKGVAEATNWLGSLTITPGDKDFWHQFRQNVNLMTGGLLFKSHAPSHKKKQGVVHHIHSSSDPESDDRAGKFPDLIYARLLPNERNDIEAYGRDPSHGPFEKNTLFYHFLLVKEIRSVLADVRSPAPKHYTYDEWAYFLKLIGQDEEDATLHTRRYNRPKKDSEEAPQVGRIIDHAGTAREWSWLSLRSPLLSQMSEPEWILHRLLEKLHSEMHISKHSRRRKSSGQKHRQQDQVALSSPQGEENEADEDDEDEVPVSMSLFLDRAGVSSRAKRRAVEEEEEVEEQQQQQELEEAESSSSASSSSSSCSSSSSDQDSNDTNTPQQNGDASKPHHKPHKIKKAKAKAKEKAKAKADEITASRGRDDGNNQEDNSNNAHPSFLALPPFTTRKRGGSEDGGDGGGEGGDGGEGEGNGWGRGGGFRDLWGQEEVGGRKGRKNKRKKGVKEGGRGGE